MLAPIRHCCTSNSKGAALGGLWVLNLLHLQAGWAPWMSSLRSSPSCSSASLDRALSFSSFVSLEQHGCTSSLACSRLTMNCRFFRKATAVPCRTHPVPLILCNYDRFYLGLMHFLKACDTNGTLAAPELKDVLLADSNEEVRHSCSPALVPAP